MLFIDTCKLYLVNWLRIWGPKMWILLFQTISLTSLFLSTLILTPVFLTHLTVNHNISSSSLYFSTWHIIPTVAWQYWVLVLNIIIITVGTTTTIRTSNPYAPSCMRGRKKKKKNYLEKGVATHSNILAWRIPWTEEPGGLQSMGSQKSWTWPNDLHFYFQRNEEYDWTYCFMIGRV